MILQATPSEVSLDEVKSKLLDLSEIMKFHDLHVWSLDGNYNVMSVHVRLKQDYKLSEVSDLKEKIRYRLHEESIEHVTIEIGGKDGGCSYGKSKI
ncbi:cation transporter [Psychroflexus aurantiacus]|uniref:cation transporter n=1 Tax=Psychroflexus aurantiacus TaxID=2709310 RepID=UPI0019681663|nr:cation transporter [Psychroflexus aurantiacus]